MDRVNHAGQVAKSCHSGIIATCRNALYHIYIYIYIWALKLYYCLGRRDPNFMASDPGDRRLVAVFLSHPDRSIFSLACSPAASAFVTFLVSGPLIMRLLVQAISAFITFMVAGLGTLTPTRTNPVLGNLSFYHCFSRRPRNLSPAGLGKSQLLSMSLFCGRSYPIRSGIAIAPAVEGICAYRRPKISRDIKFNTRGIKFNTRGINSLGINASAPYKGGPAEISHFLNVSGSRLAMTSRRAVP